MANECPKNSAYWRVPAALKLKIDRFEAWLFEDVLEPLGAAEEPRSRPGRGRANGAKSHADAGLDRAEMGLEDRCHHGTWCALSLGSEMENPAELSFVIPTYRLREVAETIEQYDRHFSTNGHSVEIIVFDDSTPANHAKYYEELEKTRTKNDVFYVGPAEKSAFLEILRSRLRDSKAMPLIGDLFRPSYGGNRNFTLMYTLGDFMVSSDDDMRPYALMSSPRENLDANEVCRGKVVRRDESTEFTQQSFDLLNAFLEVLGKPADRLPNEYQRGELLVDSAMDLETNTTTGFVRENSLFLEGGRVEPDAVVKVAQTYRSGTNDIDAVDFVDMFLENREQKSLDALGDLYVLCNFKPVVTNRNWRMDCGVAAYDNTKGLPPFFPTRLRFEDYIYRVWIQQAGFLAAHVNAAQNHEKNPYMRNAPASEVFNEEVANFLKRKILATTSAIGELSIEFGYDGEVTLEDAAAILSKIGDLHARAKRAVEEGPAEHSSELRAFTTHIEKVFYGFEPDFFQHNLFRIVNEVVRVIKASLELWPTLLEIAYFHKSRKGLPKTKVKNLKH